MYMLHMYIYMCVHMYYYMLRAHVAQILTISFGVGVAAGTTMRTRAYACVAALTPPM